MKSLPFFCAFAIIWNNSRLKSSAVGIVHTSVRRDSIPKTKGPEPFGPWPSLLIFKEQWRSLRQPRTFPHKTLSEVRCLSATDSAPCESRKICPKVTSKNAPDFSVAMSQESKTATLFRALVHLRNGLVRWTYRFIKFSTRERTRLRRHNLLKRSRSCEPRM